MELQAQTPLERLVEVVDRLLGPGGCPWDQAQTHESLKKHLLEETYEVFDAIDANDSGKLQEELGDLLLQPIMHAQMQARDGGFSTNDVAQGIVDKLIRRHPHVFGDAVAESSEAVLKQWDAIKQSERAGVSPEKPSLLDGTPKAAPALLRAHDISRRAARAGFEWERMEDVLDKLDEEVAELKSSLTQGDTADIESELGDVLFTVVNVARWSGLDAEEALRHMLDRFSARFKCMEAAAPKPLNELTPAEWDALWNSAKSSLNR